MSRGCFRYTWFGVLACRLALSQEMPMNRSDPASSLLARTDSTKSSNDSCPTEQPLLMRSLYCPQESLLKIQGNLDDPAWSRTPEYSLFPGKVQMDQGLAPAEGGTIRLLWDDAYLYVGFVLNDTDMIQKENRDQQHHYRTGDVLELFLKPADQSHYWEFYVAPNGCKTAFFFPKRGDNPQADDLAYQQGFTVAVSGNGTLNDNQLDRNWTGMLAIPLAALKAKGIPLDQNHAWTIFVGRYNYWQELTRCELTMFPPLPVASFHKYEYWARLQLD